MVEPNNGESLSQPVRPKARRHNGNRCQLATRKAIIYALANDESIASITREFGVSRHTALAIRKANLQEIEAARDRIAAAIELRCYQLAHEAVEKFGRQIQVDCSPLELLKISYKLRDRAMMLKRPLQTHTPEPFGLKFGKFRHGKRVEFSSR